MASVWSPCLPSVLRTTGQGRTCGRQVRLAAIRSTPMPTANNYRRDESGADCPRINVSATVPQASPQLESLGHRCALRRTNPSADFCLSPGHARNLIGGSGLSA